MCAKPVALPLRFVFLPIVIKARLTDRDYPWMLSQSHEVRLIGLNNFSVFRMYSNGGIQLWMRLGQRQHTGEILEIDADADRDPNLVLLHFFQQLGQPPGEIRKIEVTM